MPASDVELTRRWHKMLDELAVATGGRLGNMWARLDRHTVADRARFVRPAQVVLTAAQRRAMTLTIAYVGRLLGARPNIDLDEALKRSVINLDEPFLAFGRALNGGQALEQALLAGRSRAVSLGESGTHRAARSASTSIDETEERIVGWTRVLAGNSCEWCALISTQRYRTADSASFGHTRCNCGVAPVIGDRDPGRVINKPLLDEINARRSGAAADDVEE